MTTFRRLLVVFVAALAAACLYAQQAEGPHIGYAYPAGGRRGTEVEVKVGGQALRGVFAAFVSGGGVRAEVAGYWRPLSRQQAQDLVEKLQKAANPEGTDAKARRSVPFQNPERLKALAQQAGLTDVQLRDLLIFRRTQQNPKLQPNLQIAEIATVRLAIEPNAAPGVRDLRLLTPAGLTNPVRFVVGSLPEVVTDEGKAPETIRLPAVVNGQVMPGAVHRLPFVARKGARIVVAAAAEQLVPFLGDAVPGYFSPVLQVFGPDGKEVAYSGPAQAIADPALCFLAPADGLYALNVFDALYRGREDFVYRVTIGEVPFLTGLYPLGGRAGTRFSLQATGWNLPAKTVQVDSTRSLVASFPDSNPLTVAVDDLPEEAEKEPNNTRAKPQNVQLGVTVNGRIDRPGDQDSFAFRATAGTKVVAEVAARRLGSPLDSTLTLTDAKGRVLAFNDDFVDPCAATVMHQADSQLSATLPASGTYVVTVRDAQRRGGTEYAYRLRIGAPRPDFALRIVPASLTVRTGGTAAFDVAAIRKEGFTGEIALSLEGAPEGFMLGGAWAPAGVDRVRMTLTAPPSPFAEPLCLRLRGSAAIGGRTVVRQAVPAEDMMQAFAYHHLTPANDWLVAVLGRRNLGLRLFPPASPVHIPLGGTADVRFTGPGRPLLEPLQFELNGAPEGVTILKVRSVEGGVTVTVCADRSKLKRGAKGNLVFDAFVVREVANPKTQVKTKRKTPLGSLPAVMFAVD